MLKEARAIENSEARAGDMERDETINRMRNVPPLAMQDRSKGQGQGRRGRNRGGRKGQQSAQKSQQRGAQNQGASQSDVCGKCGNRPHQGGPKNCPANDRKCNKCHKLGHYGKMCRSKSQQVHNLTASEREGDGSYGGDEHDYPPRTYYDDQYVFSFGHNDRLPHVTANVMGKDIDFLVDTGASVDTIDGKTHKSLGSPRMDKITENVLGYGSKTALEFKGKVNTQVEVKHKGQLSTNLLVHVSENAGNILGYFTARDLGLVHVSINSITSAPSVRNSVTEKLIAEFPEVFTGIGKLKGYQAKLHIDESVTPVIQPRRHVPFHMRKRVADECKRLTNEDIIEEVHGPTKWLSPATFTDRKSGAIRLCVDNRRANQAIVRERYHSPTIDDLICDLNGARIFSVIDMREGFHQLELHPDSRDITTFSTHCGIYRWKRLFFGITSAPELFQKVIEQEIRDIPRVKNIADDIIIYGCNNDEHDSSLRMLFMRFSTRGLTLRLEKCVFNQVRVTFYGYTWCDGQIMPDEQKVKAISSLKPPVDRQQCRSVLGMTNYCARFIPRYSDITEPLRRLTRQDVEWEWGAEQQSSFQKLKDSLTSEPTLAYFNPEKDTEVLTDASPVGLSAILSQKHGNEVKVVAYASRALTPTEQRYCQTDREALGVVWGCEHYHIYLYGKPFTVYVDCQALVPIFNNPYIMTFPLHTSTYPNLKAV